MAINGVSRQPRITSYPSSSSQKPVSQNVQALLSQRAELIAKQQKAAGNAGKPTDPWYIPPDPALAAQIAKLEKSIPKDVLTAYKTREEVGAAVTERDKLVSKLEGLDKNAGKVGQAWYIDPKVAGAEIEAQIAEIDAKYPPEVIAQARAEKAVEGFDKQVDAGLKPYFMKQWSAANPDVAALMTQRDELVAEQKKLEGNRGEEGSAWYTPHTEELADIAKKLAAVDAQLPKGTVEKVEKDYQTFLGEFMARAKGTSTKQAEWEKNPELAQALGDATAKFAEISNASNYAAAAVSTASAAAADPGGAAALQQDKMEQAAPNAAVIGAEPAVNYIPIAKKEAFSGSVAETASDYYRQTFTMRTGDAPTDERVQAYAQAAVSFNKGRSKVDRGSIIELPAIQIPAFAKGSDAAFVAALDFTRGTVKG